jgi:hypothetical protein
MKEKPIEIGLAVLGATGLGFAGYVTYQYAAQEGLISRPVSIAPIPTNLLEKLQEIEATKTATPFSPDIDLTPTVLENTETTTPTATPELGDLFAGKIDLFDFEKSISGFFNLRNNQQLLISPFHPLENFDGINPEVDFAPGIGRGLTWENFYQYKNINMVDYYLYLHSGRMLIGNIPLEMTAMQEFLDMDPTTGFRRDFQIPNQIIKSDIIDSSLFLDQTDNGSTLVTIKAAIRIAPLEVNNLFTAPDPKKPWKTIWRPDLLEYLAQTYPDFGFENLLGKDRNLVLITCGTNLNGGEIPASGRKSFEQSRYIFVLTPQ